MNAKRAEESLVQSVTFESSRPSDVRLVRKGDVALISASNRALLYQYDLATGKSQRRMLNARGFFNY